MRNKQINATTIRLEAQDREAIACIRELYGYPSDAAAIKLAVRMVTRGEIEPEAQVPNPRSQATLHMPTDDARI
jgi:hypothetical protein